MDFKPQNLLPKKKNLFNLSLSKLKMMIYFP